MANEGATDGIPGEHTHRIDTAGGARLFLRQRTDGIFVLGFGVTWKDSTNETIELHRGEVEAVIGWLMDRL
jgi:hypothetical protein